MLVVFQFGGSSTSLDNSYFWTLTCHLCRQPDGTFKTKVSADPSVDDVAAILRITLRSRSDGIFMTVGRTYTAEEEIVRLSPGQVALNTVALRPEIAAVLRTTRRPPDFAAELTPDAEANFFETLNLYSSGATIRTIPRIPPLRQWLYLASFVLAAALVSYVVAWRIRLANYRSRGGERLARGQCPHCGYVLDLLERTTCPECGTSHTKWVESMAKAMKVG